MLSFSHFQGKASKRKQVLDEAYGQQGFLADSRDLVNFSHYSHYWNALSFICSRVKSSYLDVLQAEYVTTVNKLLRCLDPKTADYPERTPWSLFWTLVWSRVLTIYSRKPEIPIGKSNGLCHYVWEASGNAGFRWRRCIFHSLVSLWRVKFNCSMFTHKFLKFDGLFKS